MDARRLCKKRSRSKLAASFLSWSWRESNPRPNEEIISFLHAYLCLNFRAAAEPKPSTATLSSKNFIYAARPTWTISDVAAPLDRNASEQQLPSDVPSQHLVPGLSVDLLCFNHAARAYCLSPDKFSRTEIKVPANEALHAYLPFLPAVKSSQPHDNHSQRNDIIVLSGKDKQHFPHHHTLLLFFCISQKKKTYLCPPNIRHYENAVIISTHIQPWRLHDERCRREG